MNQHVQMILPTSAASQCRSVHGGSKYPSNAADNFLWWDNVTIRFETSKVSNFILIMKEIFSERLYDC